MKSLHTVEAPAEPVTPVIPTCPQCGEHRFFRFERGTFTEHHDIRFELWPTTDNVYPSDEYDDLDQNVRSSSPWRCGNPACEADLGDDTLGLIESLQ